ncbi:MAG: putative peptide maturation dehydrogenase [Rudaea sp.]
MRIRRCAIVLIEPHERFEFELESLLEGGSGLRTERQWHALAAHLDKPVAIDPADFPLLGDVSSQDWIDAEELTPRGDSGRVADLIAKGLLITDALDDATHRARDETVRAVHWHPYAATQQAFGRWQGIDSGKQVSSIGIASVNDLVSKLGTPPPHFHARAEKAHRLPLSVSEPSVLDEILRRRSTCRNFDRSRELPFATFSRTMKCVFGAQAVHAVTDDVAIVKKTSPSAGGLHPTEAYLLIQNVEDIASGLYHYHVGDHALEVLRTLSADEAHDLALSFLAQQDWFANAHAIVIFAPRFERSFWKYRHHAKVYRAVTLDVGHLSQTLQLTATESGLGAFVTAAINEVDIETALGLDAMRESPLAIGGFGWRAQECVRMEFDPQHAVWPAKP